MTDPASPELTAPEGGRENGSALFFPPGGLMVWIFVLLEGLTFGVGVMALAFHAAAHPDLHNRGQALLSVPLATANTLVLITSGLFAALAVTAFEARAFARASRLLGAAGALGATFLVLKLLEYHGKLVAGLGPGAGTFFSFYWGLTGFHFLHVALGTAVLLFLAVRVRSGAPFAEPDLSLHTGVVFWHMCDMIWVLVFPMVYLIHG
jgi:nitric oxide reductase NorE protein